MRRITWVAAAVVLGFALACTGETPAEVVPPGQPAPPTAVPAAPGDPAAAPEDGAGGGRGGGGGGKAGKKH